MNSKLLGGILLVIGTTIGAGMLALPIATAKLGFLGSCVLLVSCWAVMTVCAFIFIEVNLWLPKDANLISMAGATLGRTGQTVAWVFYLLLLYSILAAYISGGGDLLHYLGKPVGLNVSLSLASCLFTLLLGSIVYFGIRLVDYVNRGLMLGKMSALVLLIICISPFVSSEKLSDGNMAYIFSPTILNVTIVAFISFMIIPSLRSYFDGDVKLLRKAYMIGTLIPLLCYIAWNMVIMGVVPINGENGLAAMLNSSSANSDLLVALSGIIASGALLKLAKFFTSICMTTSFLSVGLSLSDFLADGLKIKKEGLTNNMVVFGATFLPPLLAVLFYPDAFIRGLSFAGVSGFILMIFMPPLMAWRGRYHVNLGHAQVAGGKFLLAALLIFATVMLGFGVEGAI
jgi:tyrosine-specific transport protein